MFGLGWPEILVCALVGFFVFGPERLPTVARDAARMVRQLRDMAQGVGDDLKQHLPEGDEYGLQAMREDMRGLREMNPKRMMTRALFDDDGGATTSTTPKSAAPTVPRTVPPGGVPPYDVDAT